MAEFGTPEWIEENEKRVAYLQALYKLEGRDNPDHPQHSLFTGLYQNRNQIVMDWDRRWLIS